MFAPPVPEAWEQYRAAIRAQRAARSGDAEGGEGMTDTDAEGVARPVKLEKLREETSMTTKCERKSEEHEWVKADKPMMGGVASWVCRKCDAHYEQFGTLSVEQP